MFYNIDSKSASHTFEGVVAMLETLGIHVHLGKITRQGFEGSKGLTEGSFSVRDHRSKFDITIDSDLSPENQKLTLAHEMAHIFLGHLTGEALKEEGYNISVTQREFEAEALGLMLCAFLFGLNGINNAK